MGDQARGSETKPTIIHTPGTDWSDEARATIKELWEQGLSATQIAGLCKSPSGKRTGRSAVIGVISRNGWLRHLNGGVSAPRRMAKPTAAKPVVVRPLPVPKPVKAKAEFAPVVFEGALNVSIFGREDGCGYITGECADGAAYCGRPVDRTTRSRTYCAAHHQIVYRPGTGMARATQRRAACYAR